MSAERDKLIHTWLEARQALKYWTDQERLLRDTIAWQGFGYSIQTEQTTLSGTKRYDLGNGYALKLVGGYTYGISDKLKLDTALATVRGMSGGVVTVDKIVKWTPRISKTGFEKATDAVSKMIEPAVVKLPMVPQLELESPK